MSTPCRNKVGCTRWRDQRWEGRAGGRALGPKSAHVGSAFQKPTLRRSVADLFPTPGNPTDCPQWLLIILGGSGARARPGEARPGGLSQTREVGSVWWGHCAGSGPWSQLCRSSVIWAKPPGLRLLSLIAESGKPYPTCHGGIG